MLSTIQIAALYILTACLAVDIVSYSGLFGFLLCLPLTWLSSVDIKKKEIPDASILLLLMIATIDLYLNLRGEILARFQVSVVVMGCIWALGEVYFRFKETEGLGIGDAKLFGAGTYLLGFSKLPDLLLLSSLGGMLFYAISAIRGAPSETGIPFGPFIAYALFILYFIDPILIRSPYAL